jgi:hypothetical protein
MSILDSNRKTKIDLYYAYFGYQRQPKVGSTRNHSSINDGDIVPHCKIDLEELYTDVYDKSILNYLIPTTYSLFLVIYMLKLDKNTYIPEGYDVYQDRLNIIIHPRTDKLFGKDMLFIYNPEINDLPWKIYGKYSYEHKIPKIYPLKMKKTIKYILRQTYDIKCILDLLQILKMKDPITSDEMYNVLWNYSRFGPWNHCQFAKYAMEECYRYYLFVKNIKKQKSRQKNRKMLFDLLDPLDKSLKEYIIEYL